MIPDAPCDRIRPMKRCSIIFVALLLVGCQKADSKKIFVLSGSGDTPALKAELAKGMNIDEMNALMKENNATPLHVAALSGQTEALRALLDAGFKPDLRTENDGQTALMTAAQAGKVETIAFLISKGADPKAEATKPVGMTPFEFAVIGGHVDAIELLAKYATSMAASKSLILAASNGNMDVVKAIISSGLPLDYQGGSMAAKENRHLEVAAYIDDHDDVGKSRRRIEGFVKQLGK